MGGQKLLDFFFSCVKRKTAMDVDKQTRRLEKDIEAEEGDDYILDLRKTWLLANEEEKYDVLPEIWQGKNVADFIGEWQL